MNTVLSNFDFVFVLLVWIYCLNCIFFFRSEGSGTDNSTALESAIELTSVKISLVSSESSCGESNKVTCVRT